MTSPTPPGHDAGVEPDAAAALAAVATTPRSGDGAAASNDPLALVSMTATVSPSRARGVGRPLLVGQAVPDHLEGQEVLALLAQHPAQPLDVMVVELAVARRRALGVDQALALEESDLRDGDVGELLAQQREDVADRQVASGPLMSGPAPRPRAAHSSPAAR